MAGHTLPVQAKRSGIPCRNLWDVTLTNRHRMQCAGVLTRRQGQAIVFGGAVSSFRGTQLRHDGAAAQACNSRHVDAVGRHVLDFQFFGVTSSGTLSTGGQNSPIRSGNCDYGWRRPCVFLRKTVSSGRLAETRCPMQESSWRARTSTHLTKACTSLPTRFWRS